MNDQNAITTSKSSLLDRGKPDWCPGCGDHMILLALKQAISELNIDPANTVIISGIGCGSKLPHFINTYGFEGLHGRALPVASGIKLANHKLNVIAVAGDGDAYGIGGNHFLHSCRRNLNITYITQDNSIYALTKGQTSPTSEQGKKTSSTPFGVLEEPINPISLAITTGATFVARAYSHEVDQLTQLIKQALQHKGFSLVNVLQYCPSMNKHQNLEWYKENTYKLSEHDTSDKEKARQLAETTGKLPLGLFYQTSKPTYEEQEPQLNEPLVKQNLETDITPLLKKFS
jgi:2-oxoglutarate/2-oxoacid ferredoxin oxidoreductase subunit beta